MKVAEAGEPGVPADGSEDAKPNFANSRGTWDHGLKKCSLPAAVSMLRWILRSGKVFPLFR